MSTTHIAPAEVMAELRTKQQRVWSSGDYNRIAALTVAVNETVVASAEVAPGESVLDVACGTGLVGLLACQVLGANHSQVYFVDYSQAMLEKART